MAEAGTGGGTPYFRTVSVHQCLSTLPGRKTRDRGATPYFKTASAYQGRSTLHGRRTRDRGAAPYFIPLWQIKIPPPLVGRGPGIGGPPLISVQPFRYGSGGSPLISNHNSKYRFLAPTGK